jgi:hypothetical protein
MTKGGIEECKEFSLEEQQRILELVLLEFDKVYICFDALDECDPQVRRHLLRFLQILPGTSLRVFMMGRSSVETEVTEASSHLSPRTIPIRAHEDDIRMFLSQSLAQDPFPEAVDDKLAEEIVTKVVSTAAGV